MLSNEFVNCRATSRELPDYVKELTGQPFVHLA
mgnify:CR=1 FL=1